MLIFWSLQRILLLRRRPASEDRLSVFYLPLTKRHPCRIIKATQMLQKGGDNMSTKGDRTKEDIRDKAYRLFSQKGFKDVTMKDICEETGLSRGGLYRHYDSTEQIFLEIVNGFSEKQRQEISTKIRERVPAAVILEEFLSRYEEEMADCENSFSLAICEFYSDPAVSKTENSVRKQYEASRSGWMELIHYGMESGEFKQVEPEAVFHIMVFAYQGVRMYGRLMELDENIPGQIINEVKRLLLREEDLNE